MILSTGMSTLAQIDHAVDVLGRHDLVILHSTSTYPRSIWGTEPAGDSDAGGERTQFRSDTLVMRPAFHRPLRPVALGATMVERHLTLDRAMWGSDQAASLEPNGMHRLVRDIRLVEEAMGDGQKRLLEREKPIMEKLRRVGA